MDITVCSVRDVAFMSASASAVLYFNYNRACATVQWQMLTCIIMSRAAPAPKRSRRPTACE
jgi:hypothetical protein